MPAKSRITIAGVPVAARGTIAWRLVSGVKPYQTVFMVHKDQWPRLSKLMGQPVKMVVQNIRSTVTVEQLYILHEVSSDSPNRRAFLVSDRRWKWEYTLVAKDYNMTRRTGDRTLIGAKAVDAPVELGSVVDLYYYRPYSLNEDVKWNPRTFLMDVFKQVEPEDSDRIVESFPLAQSADDGAGGQAGGKGSDEGGMSIQNLVLRDSGDAAFARALAAVAGADVYVRLDGKVALFNALSKYHTEAALREAKPATWDGDRIASVDRKAIRPSKINVHFQRELEVLFEYADDFGGSATSASSRNDPYIENVMQTVDPSTTVTEYDPITQKNVEKQVPQGTWCKFSALLEAWNKDKPDGSLPWTFDTIKMHWLHGDLEGALGAKGLDLDKDGNVSNRVAMIRQHFRQSFRINQRYMERVRDIQAVRVFLLDPVTGTRAPATVWGQACVVTSTKGRLIASRDNPDEALVYRNVDYFPTDAEQVKDKPPGPTRVVMLDRDLGIFRLEWIVAPSGTVESFVPCHLVGEDDATKPRVPSRDLEQQDKKPMGPGMKVEGGTNGIFLRETMKYKVLLTLVPCAPNSASQFHVEAVEAQEIEDKYEVPWSLSDGDGPEYNVFVNPSESTARFGWLDDGEAKQTLLRLLGLDGKGDAGAKDDPSTKDKDESKDLPGYEFVNKRSTVIDYARAVAAEILVPFADGKQGALVTDLDPKATLRGRMGSVTIMGGPAPGGKVQSVLEFPGQSRPIDRFAVLPEATRHLVLGIVPFGKGDR